MKLEYFIVLAVCMAGPLVLSFSKKLAFYKSPCRLVLAIMLPMIIFIAWDITAAHRGHWGFNPEYVTGLFIFNLPIEDFLFGFSLLTSNIVLWEYFTKKNAKLKNQNVK